MKTVSKFFCYCISCLICITAVQPVWAGCVYPPDWQTVPPGTPPTTYQRWTFDEDENPALPTTYRNDYVPEYENVQAEILGLPIDTWGWYNRYNGRNGVWHADSLEMRLHVPNQPGAPSDSYKDIYLGMIYQGDLREPTVATDVEGQVDRLCKSVTYLEDGWQRLDMWYRVSPNPSEEWICIGLGGTGGSIDEVTVETICVPEPATIALIGLGGLVTRLKKRRT